jgi:hypothetical protein
MKKKAKKAVVVEISDAFPISSGNNRAVPTRIIANTSRNCAPRPNIMLIICYQLMFLFSD